MPFRKAFFDSTSHTIGSSGLPVGNNAEHADFLAKIFANGFGSGISYTPSSTFLCYLVSGMTVRVKQFFLSKDGYYAWNDEETEITLTSSTSEQVIYIETRLDLLNKTFVGGNVGAFTSFNPETDTASCRITIPANAITLTEDMLYDLRSFPSYCGYINQQQVQLAGLAAEFEAQMASMLAAGVPIHHTLHAAGGSDPLSIRVSDTSVLAAAFVADATYEDFPYRATVPVSGALASMDVDVRFAVAEQISGNYGPVESYDGGVRIYAVEPPAGTIIIPRIIFTF